MCMQKGFNSDITVRGKNFHVQTEDWGRDNPFLVSRVFSNGAVLKTIKVSYLDALKGGPANEAEALKIALKKQHHKVLDAVMSGEL